jgi:hypothetical protein
MGCQHYRSAAGPECHFHRSLGHRPLPNVFGRCVDDSCHAAGFWGRFGPSYARCCFAASGAARLLDEEGYLSRNLPDKAGLPHQGWMTRRDELGVLCPCSVRQNFSQTSLWSNVISRWAANAEAAALHPSCKNRSKGIFFDYTGL